MGFPPPSIIGQRVRSWVENSIVTAWPITVSTWRGQQQSCSGNETCASSREGVTVNIRARQTKIYEKKCPIMFKLYLGHK